MFSWKPAPDLNFYQKKMCNRMEHFAEEILHSLLTIWVIIGLTSYGRYGFLDYYKELFASLTGIIYNCILVKFDETSLVPIGCLVP